MKRALDEPSTSTGKRARPTRFTIQQVVEALADSDSDEAEFHQEYDYSSSSDADLDLDLDNLYDRTSSDDEDRARSSLGGGVRGHFPRTADCGDARSSDDEGWTYNFVAPGVNLNFNDDGTGPVNIPEYITGESSCLDFLSLFTDDNFWQNLTDKTNLRAHQVRTAKPNTYHAKNYQDASVVEMKAFIGIRIYMEYICIKPSYRDYWNNEGTDFLGFTPGFRKVVTRDRWLALWSFLHIVDEDDPDVDKADRIYKVRPFLNDLLVKFQHFYFPRQHLSLDEGMIPTKNRLAIKQYIKDKPTKWGIKSFLLTESETGYIINAEIYTGAALMPVPDLGAVGNTVLRLLTSCEKEKKSHILVMDRYYNSINLCNYLLNEQQTGVIGTLLQNRKHFPKSLKNVGRLARGESRYRCKGGITVMVWQDRKPITFISNCSNPTQVDTVNRRNKDGTVQEIEMPQLVKDCNHHMGGCDKNDQMTRLHRSRRHYRWPRRLFIKFFMWACYNSFVLYVSARQNVDKKPLYFTRYIQQLCLELIGDYRTSAVRRGQVEPCPQRMTQGNHFPQIDVGPTSNHICTVCMEKHLRYNRQNPGVTYKDNPNKKVKTNIYCSLCTKYLCVKPGSTCWADWHTKVEYWR